MSWPRCAAHDLHRYRRERHAHEKLSHTDPATVLRHEAAVGGAGEYASASDGMPIYCRYDRLWAREHAQKHAA
jgi:hypothetical protein